MTKISTVKTGVLNVSIQKHHAPVMAVQLLVGPGLGSTRPIG